MGQMRCNGKGACGDGPDGLPVCQRGGAPGTTDRDTSSVTFTRFALCAQAPGPSSRPRRQPLHWHASSGIRHDGPTMVVITFSRPTLPPCSITVVVVSACVWRSLAARLPACVVPLRNRVRALHAVPPWRSAPLPGLRAIARRLLFFCLLWDREALQGLVAVRACCAGRVAALAAASFASSSRDWCN